MNAAVAPGNSAVRLGVARGRYFRENFAQGGVDLVQIIPELVTNADAAIAAAGHATGRITLELGSPDPAFLDLWEAQMRALRSPALLTWRHELRCTDNGEGVDAAVIDQRLGALGVEPPRAGQRGLFGRGLRDVWLAQGAGRIEGVRAGRSVESWFFPAPGDEPYAFMHLHDAPATPEMLRALGLEISGTRVTVPLSTARLPPAGRLRTVVSQLVQLRPVLEDPARALYLVQPGQTPQLVRDPAPEPDPEQPVLFDGEVAVTSAIAARIVVRRAVEPISQGFSRATRRGGLVIRSGRAAHETTLAGFEGRPGARHLYGEVYCEAIEALQRDALHKPRPELVVKVDRSGLNEHHPIVAKLYAAIDHVLKPIVAAEERRAGAHLIAAPRAVTARDEVGLRALNDLLKTAFEQPGHASAEPGNQPAANPPARVTEQARGDDDAPGAEEERPPGSDMAHVSETLLAPLRFKQSPIRVHPGEKRTVTLIANPVSVPPGTAIEIESDPGLTVALHREVIPEPHSRGSSTVQLNVRARVTVEPGSRLTVLAAAGEHSAELELVIVRHRAAGWVREIARKNTDQSIEAEFDPETGIVTVHEGRREFRELERAAHRAGYTRKRAPEYVPFRMLEVEAAANAVYQWAASEVIARRISEERPTDPAEYAQAVHFEAQALRHRAHHKLMQAFLEPEIFEGSLTLMRKTTPSRQLRLVEPDRLVTQNLVVEGPSDHVDR
ncbi:MAG TPA: hypothetical protein VG228_05680 [Solirubrobacteraceae bacterium]|jgi:hypothetical protein|nr:hypothetical protein [Solirubrobacteraceae bacterium]